MEKRTGESLTEGLSLLGDNRAAFKGLETFPAPDNVDKVSYESDEVTAICPVTGQPDWYNVRIELDGPSKCIESKSLKLFLQSFRNAGHFCEQFASIIAEQVHKATDAECVSVQVRQKPRGGVAINASAFVSGVIE